MAIALNEQLLKPKAFIDGDWVDAHAGATTGAVNPATGEVVATVGMLGRRKRIAPSLEPKPLSNNGASEQPKSGSRCCCDGTN